LTGSALAQGNCEPRGANYLYPGDCSSYFVTYFSNNAVTGAPDETIRLVNDGNTATHGDAGNGDLWAAFYVFDDSEEMSECCSCRVTPDGLLSESVESELTANPLSGPIRSRGVIKIISDGVGSAFAPEPTPGLRGFATHVQQATSGYAISETSLSDANLGSFELGNLGNLCSVLIELGSGNGSCTCTREDHDF